MSFCAGVMFEDKNLRKWFTKELDAIEKHYKCKYENENGKVKTDTTAMKGTKNE